MAPRTQLALALTVFTGLLATAILFLGGSALATEPLSAAAAAAPGGGGQGLGYIAAALATGLSSLAAGFAVAHVGAAAIGAVTEKPELLGRMLILVGLAEGIAIYGLIVSILILNRLG
ncbi:MAG: H+transporting two-sector ATPase C subunit [Magnetococcales bacterium]|nr:H+transporting two-sector ATPase C subunit [Magnetococcales bacterium]